MSSKLGAVLAFSFVVSLPAVASADSDPKPRIQKAEATEERTEKTSYGNQTLVADGISAGAVALGALVGGDMGNMLAGTGVLGFIFAAPALHVSKGFVARGFADAGMRVLIPTALGLGGALLGTLAFNPDDGAASPEAFDRAFAPVIYGGIAGTVVGAIIASTIDSQVMAKEDAKTVRVSPTISPTKTGLSVGVGGTF